MPSITPRLGLKKPLGTEVVDISVLNDNADAIDAGVAKKADFDTHVANTSNPHNVTTTQIGAIPTSDKGVANGVATLDSGGKIPTGQLPTSGVSATSITQDSTHRFATDAEKTTWNGKVDGTEVVTSPAANKILKLDANSKLPASITGDAATVNGVQIRNNAGKLEFWDGTAWKGVNPLKKTYKNTYSIATISQNTPMSLTTVQDVSGSGTIDYLSWARGGYSSYQFTGHFELWVDGVQVYTWDNSSTVGGNDLPIEIGSGNAIPSYVPQVYFSTGFQVKMSGSSTNSGSNAATYSSIVAYQLNQ